LRLKNAWIFVVLLHRVIVL